MSGSRLRTNVVGMTMNWYVADSLIADRNIQQMRAENRRWPELDHARRMQSARDIGRDIRSAQGPVGGRRPAAPVTVSPGHRLANLLRGLAAGRPVAQR